MATLTQFLSEIDECRTAMGAEDYVLARKKLTLARVTLIAVPDSEMNEEKVVWNRKIDDISAAIKQLEDDQTRANSYENGPMFFQKIEQVRE